MGRKPHSFEMLLDSGSVKEHPGKYASRANTPKSKTKIYRPRGMPQAEITVWNRVVEMLDGLGILDSTDAWLIRLFCEAWVEYQDLRRSGDPDVKHVDIRGARKQCLDLIRELGLSSSGRLRLAPSKKKEEENPLQALRAHRAG